MFSIGIIGHRFFDQTASAQFVRRASHTLLGQQQATGSRLLALSALAEGADSLFAAAALELQIPLLAVRPFNRYEEDFTTATSLETYRQLQRAAVGEVLLPFTQRSVEAYESAMKWIVHQGQLLVMAWDGLPARGRGGTGDAVLEAIRIKRPWIHLDVIRQEIIHNTDHTSAHGNLAPAIGRVI